MASKIKSSRGGVRAGSGRPTSELRKNMVIRIKPSVIEMMAGEKSKSLLIERLVEGYYAAKGVDVGFSERVEVPK